MRHPHHDTTGDLLMLAARLLRRRFSLALEEYAISPSQSRALRTIVEEESVRLSAIAEQLRIAPRSATDLVDALEQQGWVARAPDPADRRATLVTATATGIALQETIHRARHRELDGFAAHLDPVERADLDRLLRRVVQELSDPAEEPEPRPGSGPHLPHERG